MEIYDFKIWLDAGHGGTDAGAVSLDGTLKEKDINLDLAQRVRTILLNWGCLDSKIGMTRTTDTYVDYATVSGLANNWGASIFVSIHINASPLHSGTGTETYVHSTQATTYDTSLAQHIQTKIVNALGSQDRGIRTGSLAVLSNNNAYACLAEPLFIDYSTDFNMLKDTTYRQKIAQAIADGIDAFVFEKFHNISTY